MSKLVKTVFLMAAVMLTSSIAYGASSIVLNYNGEHLRGQNTLKLKMKARQQGISVQGMELLYVKLTAKTKMGRGTATLKVGQALSNPQVVDGYPNEFHDSGLYTYDSVWIGNPKNDSQGPWQIALKGNFKIESVELIVEGYQDFEEAGQIRFFKQVHFTQSLNMDQMGRVKGIKLKAGRSGASIAVVEVIFGNGRARRLSQLEGTLGAGEQSEITFRAPRGRRIQEIFVTAKAAGQNQSRGRVKVLVDKSFY